MTAASFFGQFAATTISFASPFFTASIDDFAPTSQITLRNSLAIG